MAWKELWDDIVDVVKNTNKKLVENNIDLSKLNQRIPHRYQKIFKSILNIPMLKILKKSQLKQ